MTIDIYESTTDNIIFNEPSSPNITIHPKILREICMEVGIMATPHQTTKWVPPLLLFGFKTQQQP